VDGLAGRSLVSANVYITNVYVGNREQDHSTQPIIGPDGEWRPGSTPGWLLGHYPPATVPGCVVKDFKHTVASWSLLLPWDSRPAVRGAP
jgi:hypothetical protein